MSRDKVSEKVQEAIFNQLSTKSANDECADCKTKSPTWISLDFGVFVCIRCSGVHRQLGQHITRIRSTRLDGWYKEDLEVVAAVGNKLANEFYEYSMPGGYRRPVVSSTPEECRRYVDEKYVRKAFAPKDHPTPVKEFIDCRKNGTKPAFSFSKGRQTTEQAVEAPVVHENHRQTNTLLRKKSMSLDKLPPAKSEQTHHHVDLMTHDDDLLSGGNDGFGDFKQAHSASPQKKTINFANFKKAQNDNVQQQQQAQPQTQNDWTWDLTSAQANPQPQNPTTQSQNEQKPAENKVDLMKLYTQPGPVMPQSNFMHGGMHPQQFNGNMYGNHNTGMHMNGGYNNGHMGQQNHFQGGYPNQFGGQQGFNPNMGYNNAHMNHNVNMGYNQVPATGGFGNNLYQNNGFMPAQNAPNKFF